MATFTKQLLERKKNASLLVVDFARNRSVIIYKDYVVCSPNSNTSESNPLLFVVIRRRLNQPKILPGFLQR